MKFSLVPERGRCTTRSRCTRLDHAISEAAHGALDVLSVINLRTGEPRGTAVVLRLRKGAIGTFLYCPWCGGRLVALHKMTPAARKRFQRQAGAGGKKTAASQRLKRCP